jgi:phenylacetate-coenzyme A ligase PaaK-like adenylate-forming protein
MSLRKQLNGGAEMAKTLADRIFGLSSDDAFEELSLEVYRYQYAHNPLYRTFADLNHASPGAVETYKDIPFLPVGFFRDHDVVTQSGTSGLPVTFLSSGTTGAAVSRHIVTDPLLYQKSFLACFRLFFGDITNCRIFALLPSYLEREGSSLVYMVDHLIKETHSDAGGFFLDDFAALERGLRDSMAMEGETILIGVTFALLDFAASTKEIFPGLTVVETGGMKGRRREIIREELHTILKGKFGIEYIAGEYGMTELCSQAWSLREGIFHTPPWMKVMIREINDPRALMTDGKTGAINVTDLANLNSCAFLATQDLGRKLPGGGFEVLGRFDGSDVRGCNLMVL